MQGMFNIEPEIIAHDLHPDYLSSKFAKKYASEHPDILRVPVQHHHAHIAACMAENLIDGPVIGLALDGTGYGTDGRIWGGEVLIVEAEHFQRSAHLAYIPMPGAAAAVREPWRMGIGYLYHTFGNDLFDLDIPFLQKIDKKRIKTLVQMISAKINSPLTSSMGRLFDAVAAITGIRNNITYTGQAAMELESISGNQNKKLYKYVWDNNEIISIDVRPVIRGIVLDLEKRIDPSIIGCKFHNTLIKMLADVCSIIKNRTGLNRVALSGGVFLNKILSTGLTNALKSNDFKVFTHCLTPANDGGLALGQAVVAAAKKNNKN